jgi:TonB family protein
MRYVFFFCMLALSASVSAFGQAPPSAPPVSSATMSGYPNTPDGFQLFIDDILRAIKSQDVARENRLIDSILVPENSTWFTDVYGVGFGANLEAIYRLAKPGLPGEIKSIYEENVRRGWTAPKIVQYLDPEKVDSPIDHFLNCMNTLVPLYTTNFHGNSMSIYPDPNPHGPMLQSAGDLDGLFMYDRDGFRFIPMNILMKLPRSRPARIELSFDVMHSKISNEIPVKVPTEAVRNRISGTAAVEVILDVDGKILETKAVAGPSVLSNALLDAVKQWRFAPTKLDGEPVEVSMRIEMVFNMQ